MVVRFIKNTAVEKLMAVCDKALAFRKEQEDALGHSGGCSHARAKKLGDVTTLNLTSKKEGIYLAYQNSSMFVWSCCPFSTRVTGWRRRRPSTPCLGDYHYR